MGAEFVTFDNAVNAMPRIIRRGGLYGCIQNFLFLFLPADYPPCGLSGGNYGIHMLRHTGMCCPNGLLFHQNSLDMDPILVKKSLKEGPISSRLRKKKHCKISYFEMLPNL